MSYTIDVYRGKLAPTRNPLLFFGYISLFPQLVAGPIVRATTLLPQLEKPPRVFVNSCLGRLALGGAGLFQKDCDRR